MARIKESFPHKPVMTTLAWPVVTDDLVLPANLDWIGFDRYGDFSAIPPLLETLKTKLAAHQRIFLVPDGILRNNADADVAAVSHQYHQLADSDPLVIGELVFHWSESRKLPLTFAAQEEIGRETKLHIQYLRRKSAVSDGYAYQAQFGSAPGGQASGLFAPSSVPPSVENLGGDWEVVTIDDDQTSTTHAARFARLQLTLGPD